MWEVFLLLFAPLELNFDDYSRGINRGDLLRVTENPRDARCGEASRSNSDTSRGPPHSHLLDAGMGIFCRAKAGCAEPEAAWRSPEGEEYFVTEGSLTLLPHTHTQAEHQQLEKPRCFCRACLCVCVYGCQSHSTLSLLSQTSRRACGLQQLLEVRMQYELNDIESPDGGGGGEQMSAHPTPGASPQTSGPPSHPSTSSNNSDGGNMPCLK